jgi:hypothetical protein
MSQHIDLGRFIIEKNRQSSRIAVSSRADSAFRFPDHHYVLKMTYLPIFQIWFAQGQRDPNPRVEAARKVWKPCRLGMLAVADWCGAGQE